MRRFVLTLPLLLASAAVDASPSTAPRDFPNCLSAKLPPIHQTQREYATVTAPGKGAVHLRAYVFSPPPGKPGVRHPVIAMFHGGGFHEGFPVTWFPAAQFFASRGFVAVAFQYRLRATHGTSPTESVADALTAHRWLRDHAAELGIDPDRVVALGDSAGATLALALALAPRGAGAPKSPRAIVALYPLVDMRLLKGFAGFSPIDALDSAPLPPTFILQGAKDDMRTTPPARSREFCAKANRIAKRAVCDAQIVDGPPEFPHGCIGSREQYRFALSRIEKFLIEQGLESTSRRFDPKSDRLPAECEAPDEGSIFKGWLRDYGYATASSSLW